MNREVRYVAPRAVRALLLSGSVNLIARWPTYRRKACSCGLDRRSIADASGSHSNALMSLVSVRSAVRAACMRQKWTSFGRPLAK